MQISIFDLVAGNPTTVDQSLTSGSCHSEISIFPTLSFSLPSLSPFTLTMSDVYFECIEHTGLCQHIRQYPRATSTSQEQLLRVSIKQYKPRYEEQAGDVTILAAPALSCAKELYEPTWDALYEQSRRDESNLRIRSIWSIDFCNQGASGVLNEDALGDERTSVVSRCCATYSPG